MMGAEPIAAARWAPGRTWFSRGARATPRSSRPYRSREGRTPDSRGTRRRRWSAGPPARSYQPPGRHVRHHPRRSFRRRAARRGCALHSADHRGAHTLRERRPFPARRTIGRRRHPRSSLRGARRPFRARERLGCFGNATKYTVKLEGARLAGYQTVAIGGVRRSARHRGPARRFFREAKAWLLPTASQRSSRRLSSGEVEDFTVLPL